MHRLSLLTFALAAGALAAGGLPAQTPLPGQPAPPGLPTFPGQPGVPGPSDVRPDEARLILRVPAGATVTLNGEASKQTGTERLFSIPNLKKGYIYEYDVEVKWKADGKDRVERKSIRFEPGQAKRFEIGPPSTGTPTPKKGETPEKKTETAPPEKKVETPPQKKTEPTPPEKKVEPTPPEKKTEKKVEPTPPEKKTEKKGEPTPPEKKAEKKVEPTPPEKKAEKKVEPPPETKDQFVPEKKTEKKVETIPQKKVPTPVEKNLDLPTEKKVEPIPQKKVPTPIEKKVDPPTEDKVEPAPEKKTDKTTPPKKKDVPKDLPPEAKLPTKGATTTAAEPVRTFLFTYAGKVKDLAPGAKARVWLPMATSNGQQEVSVVSQQIPGTMQVAKGREYGNTILYFEGTAGEGGTLPFEVTYRVRRTEVKTDVQGNLYLKPAPGEKVDRFLQPDAKVPVDGKPLELLKTSLKDQPLPADQSAAAKAMYDLVNRHMTYKKVGTGWGQGDALWACDSRYGNCTDFHSLFIAMARGHKIPSKFEMGFAIPAQHGGGPVPGYHCWAWFLPQGKGWVPVDISEANQHPDLARYYFGNLSASRVAFTVGRDIELEPPQKGPPLNFFVYPYVEVDGQPYPADKVERQFTYKDVP